MYGRFYKRFIVHFCRFFTGNPQEDDRTRLAVVDLLETVKTFPEHFDEKSMFSGDETSQKLKDEFRLHFLNITRIMDCVGCDKCKLWGKLQIQGLGTALKILFTPEEDMAAAIAPRSDPVSGVVTTDSPTKFRMRRNEIVALFNAFARISSSIHHLETFRAMMR